VEPEGLFAPVHWPRASASAAALCAFLADASGPLQRTRAGLSVAISATHVVVGARGDDDKGHFSGSAYIYKSHGEFVAKLTAPDGANSDQFGALGSGPPIACCRA
jgi:hypothetical protein